MQGTPSISKVLEGPGAEARAARLRRRFRAASRGGLAGPLARVGRGVLILYWAGCLAVILAGLDRMYPEAWATARSARPVAGLSAPVPGVAGLAAARPFATCGAAHAAGVYDIPAGSRAYVSGQDGDGDGLACEPVRSGADLAF
jgi:hypothetical protein